jgi:hypothetical protein
MLRPTWSGRHARQRAYRATHRKKVREYNQQYYRTRKEQKASPAGQAASGREAVAQFLPESEMMNIIISQDTLKKIGQDEKSALIEIPVSHLYVNTGYTKKTGSISYYVENGVDSREGIVLLRMPTQIYDKLIEEFNGEKTLSLPTTYFYRFYANFDDLNSHVKIVNESVEITPSSLYPVPGLLEDSNHSATIQKSLVDDSSASSFSTTDTDESLLTRSDPEEYCQWASSTRIYSGNYKYCIGQIRPYSWTLTGSGADLFRLYAEREYKFDNNEAVEIVVSYRDRIRGGGIELAPTYYRSGAVLPIAPSEWLHWEGYVYIDPNDLPHAYGYHVQLAYSGQYVQINFEDMNTLQWTNLYFVAAATPISSFTQLDSSSEYIQMNVPTTDTFNELTYPIIEEWICDINGYWDKPINVWTSPVLSPPSEQYVNIVTYWDGYGNLIASVSAHYP